MELKRLEIFHFKKLFHSNHITLPDAYFFSLPINFLQILGKKDILATLHPGAPEAESSSLGKETRKSLGVLHTLGAKAQADAQESLQGGRGKGCLGITNNTFQ